MALEAQCIAALPNRELEKVIEKARKEDFRTIYYSELVKVAWPYWYRESRQEKHQTTATKDGATRRGDYETGFPHVLVSLGAPSKTPEAARATWRIKNALE